MSPRPPRTVLVVPDGRIRARTLFPIFFSRPHRQSHHSSNAFSFQGSEMVVFLITKQPDAAVL